MAKSTCFDPRTNKFPYPIDTDKHYLVVKKDDGTKFDKDYPYIDKSKKMRFKMRMVRILLYLIVFPLSYIRMGLRIKGKKILRKNKKILKQGVISICNHVHMWDYIGIMNAIKPFKSYLLVWNKNISGEMGGMIRSVGGIPIPSNDPQATIAYVDVIKDHLNSGGWLHIYPEGSMWEYYRPIRPFKKGIVHFARMTGKPILPLAYSYRKPSWIRRVIFRQIALFTLHIGEPLFIDESLPVEEQEIDLLKRAHEAICVLAGMSEEENLYEPIFNGDKRIDYYTDTYGVGYKGSH